MFDNEYELGQGLLGEKLRENTERSLEERTKATYAYITELCEKASNNSKSKIKFYATDDTSALFRDERIFDNVAKSLKEERVTMRMRPVTLWNDRAYITISW